ncbi:MAG: hypothetical protein OXM59_04725 [Gammaproteobacteria bacterium]|nr:hypothetical protein [Gammaproteobacteria bacterium]
MDENDEGAMVAMVTTENASEVTVDNDYFEVADGNLKLKDGMSLDFENVEGGMIELTLTASGDGESATAMVTVTVNDVNEAPTIGVADGETPDGMAASSTVDENVTGAILGAITLSDQDAGQAHTLSTSDDRFVTKQDAEGGWWLALADGVSLDHEAGATVTVTVTVTDDGDPAMSASTAVTITVNDVNEAPVAVGMVDAITTESGVAIKPNAIDLLALFNDPDAGDANAVRYEMSGGPSWLTFSVEFGEDDDGNDTAMGIFSGTPPTTGPDSDAAHMVTLTATDSGGEEGSVSFYVIVDDGNDAITAVDFIDNSGNVVVEAEVDDNDATGVVLGEIRVHDQDHAMHPNGTHLIQILKGDVRDSSLTAELDDRFEVKYDDAGIPWLVLKAGASLDFERDRGAVDVTIRAVDLNGATNSRGTAFSADANIEYQAITVVINDRNDAPKAETIGNWWVTTERGQRSDDIQKGEWLTFSLTADDTASTTDKPAFTDPDGDTLTYALQGPSFLEINARTGEITNTKGGVPVEGVHRLTVTATDPDDQSATATFNLAVAFSDSGTAPGSTDPYTVGNSAPRFASPTEFDYPENSGERRVATFTVTDDENNLGHHPFALDSVRITAVANGDANRGVGGSDADIRNTVDDATTPLVNEALTANFGLAFRLSEPRKSGNSWTYDLWVRDTNPGRTDTTAILDHEDVGSIDVTITASDGTDPAVTETINVRIVDVNDRPMAGNIGDNPATPAPETNVNIQSGTYGVNQSDAQKEVLYIKLEEIWTDQEDQPTQLTFTASVSGSWIKILHGPADWSDIEDDATWNDTTDQTAVVIGTDTTPPAGNEQVVIIELDRTGRNNDQGAIGSFTLTARDRDGGTTSKTYMVPVTDDNEIPSNAVTITGSAREDATLRANFNDDRDPDLAGSAEPALIVYQWFRGTAADGSDATTVFYQSTSKSYTPTEADIGSYITVKVKYYEVFQSQLVPFDTTSTTVLNQATTSRMVTDTPDKGTGSVTITADGATGDTTNNGQLSVADTNVSVRDGDYVATGNPTGAVPDANLFVSWEVSDNGRGGWETVEGTGPNNLGVPTDTPTLTLDDGKGKWYRAVVTYDADGNDEDTDTSDGDDDLMESIYSDPIQVSDISDDATTPLPTITGNAVVGGTLSVQARNTSVQWQVQRGTDWFDLPGATGSLTLTQAHAGSVIRALVSYQSTDDDNPGITAVVTVDVNGGTAIPGARPPATPVPVGKHDIELSVDAPGHGATNNAGHNLSHTEMVDLAGLFQDPDSGRLTFSVLSVTGTTTATNSGTGSTYVYDNIPGGVLTFEASTGKLTFNSDTYRNHDGTDTDGDGNMFTLNINASDGANTSATQAAVNVRINVAPTDIFFADSTGTVGGATDGAGARGTFVVTNVSEHVGSAAAAARTGDLIAHVNVRDENADSHKFGTHEVTLSGDDRFMITHTGYTGLPTSRDTDRLGSTWEVRLKPGEKLDYETQVDMDPATAGKQIVLTLTATDESGDGLSTPSGPGISPITLTISLVDVDAAGGDRNHPAPTPDDVPGLEDDETTDPDNERVDDGTDDDTDGGSHPPPPGMSLGGIIEDFIDNMDNGDQDLLEDFLLTIDDGLDIV